MYSNTSDTQEKKPRNGNVLTRSVRYASVEQKNEIERHLESKNDNVNNFFRTKIVEELSGDANKVNHDAVNAKIKQHNNAVKSAILQLLQKDTWPAAAALIKELYVNKTLFMEEIKNE
jgi:flagellar basal body-associated protein FliL